MDTKKWAGEIDIVTSLFSNAFGELSTEKLNWKPNSKTWSIAQNIDHLIVTNRTYFPIFENIRNNTYSLPWFARFDFFINFCGKVILDAVQPDRRKKMKTFRLWQPSESLIEGDILKQFVIHQSDLKKLIESSRDMLDKRTVISSPANRNIVYKLETAFDIIIAHEKRHFEQAKEILTKQPNVEWNESGASEKRF